MRSYLCRPWRISRRFMAALTIVIGTFVAIPSLASATPYGSGGYGQCAYGGTTSCSNNSSSTPSTPSRSASTPSETQSTPTAGTGIIVLNTFQEYFGDGKDLTLTPGQTVYFDLIENNITVRHSVTLKQIGSDFVVLTLTSKPRDVTIYVGETKAYDVNSDKINDIQISLLSITSSTANLRFALFKPSATPAAAVVAPASPHHQSWAWLWYVVCLVVGLLLLITLWWHRRHQKSGVPPASQL